MAGLGSRTVKVTVTPECWHKPNETGTRYISTGQPFVGSHAVISQHGVILDGVTVIARDHRAKVNREAGHPWVTDNGRVIRDNLIPWTGFQVTVEP